MRIKLPSISHQQNRHVLSASISVEASVIDCPKSVWFATYGDESLFLPGMTDAFIVGLIAPAMHLGEDIWVEGTVSTRLAHGLDTYQNILNTWWPDTFKPVDIHYENLADRRQDVRPTGVGCTFSGGVDSYHAVLQMLPAHMKYSGFSITHALMINGFDQLVDLKRQGMAQKMFSNYQSALKEWNVSLFMIDTNLKSFRSAILNRRDEVRSYSGPLAACAHALGGVFGRFGISGHATYAYNELFPEGSHVALDHHLSSDQLQITHTGTAHSRARKTEIIADYPNVQKSLRVCARDISFDQQTGAPANCCHCEKCFRTMVTLMIIGKLGNFSTFSKSHLPLKAYHDPNILCTIHDHLLQGMTDLAERHGRSDWVAILDAARARRRELEVKNQGPTVY